MMWPVSVTWSWNPAFSICFHTASARALALAAPMARCGKARIGIPIRVHRLVFGVDPCTHLWSQTRRLPALSVTRCASFCSSLESSTVYCIEPWSEGSNGSNISRSSLCPPPRPPSHSSFGGRIAKSCLHSSKAERGRRTNNCTLTAFARYRWPSTCSTASRLASTSSAPH